MAHVHIGRKIREVLDRSPMSITDFASEINRTRDVAYKIFAKDHIDTSLLQKISKVLNHDFFSYFSAGLSLVKEREQLYGYATREEVRSLTETVQALAREIEKLREALPQAKKKKAAKNVKQ